MSKPENGHNKAQPKPLVAGARKREHRPYQAHDKQSLPRLLRILLRLFRVRLFQGGTL